MDIKSSKAIIHVKRIKQFGETTLGKLTIEGVNKSWYVLEPGGPDSIIEGSDKRIKAGTYNVLLYNSDKYKNVYELKNVPGRTKILIHSGNYHDDTEGCLMPGKTWGAINDKQYHVGNSRTAFNEIKAEIQGKKSIQITITNQLED
ncbi:DUF5675 family protein [Photobacterium sp. J15]|uniref:DUF5675 family protein n=1 Tax=Photobacterium sp. J15 TaxID=265901 RepID=UPI0007E47AE3|nr:DUF5675 family protein [Photobacterium sp. J15]